MMTDAIRNKDGFWINSNVFREEALHFEKYGYYCPHTWNSPAWAIYWEEQRDRCLNGYEVANVKITGNHYYYLNFVKIQAINKKTGKKIERFPDFWDGDYEYFWALDIAEKGISVEDYKNLKLFTNIKGQYLNGNRHLIVGKSRRKGYSYKNSAVLANVYFHIRNSLCLVGSFDKKYSKDAFAKAINAIDFGDANTGFRKQRLIDKKTEHIKSGYIDNTTGINIEKGYRSEIVMLTYQDNPDAARGKDAYKIILEEMGTFPNAINAFTATEPSVKDGDIMTGQMIMYGTSSTKTSMTEPFKQMFYNPDIYNILPFDNIWDDNSESSECGFFHPVYLNKQGYYDEQGNSDRQKAIDSELVAREKKKINSTALNNYIVENPISPEEAFKSGGNNIFPVIELENQLKKVLANKWHIKKGQPVEIYQQEGIVKAKPILDTTKVEPIYYYKQEVQSTRGAVIIYEYPIENSPKGLYKIGYDPYAQDQSKSQSLGAIYVYKGIEKNSYNRNIIVAQYVGRPEEADDVNRISLLLAKLYNTEVMHENMFIHVKNFFRKYKELNRLAAQPDTVISKNIKESSVSRVYGIHMNEQLKDAGEKYIKDWLLEVKDFDENGDGILNLEFIYDTGLLQELINYNRYGNFDRVIAMMMVMFQIQETHNLEYDTKNNTDAIQEWYNFIDKIKSKQF